MQHIASEYYSHSGIRASVFLGRLSNFCRRFPAARFRLLRLAYNRLAKGGGPIFFQITPAATVSYHSPCFGPRHDGSLCVRS